MKCIKWLFVLTIPVLMSFLIPHPIYISTTEIDYKADTKRLEIAVKIFSDDLGKVLSDYKNETVEIGTDREHAKATEYIVEYLQEHFVFELNGKAVPYNYVTRKLEKKDFYAMWILLEVPKVRKIKSLKLKNNLLIDFYPQQQNIINYREGRGSYKKYQTNRNKIEQVLK